MTAAVAIILGVLLAGVVIVAVGVRGRKVSDHPHCRGCGFDLVGVTIRANDSLGPSPLCPECGAMLDERAPGAMPRPIRMGRRRRLHLATVPGAALIVLGLSVVVLFGPVGAGGAWVQRHAPTSALIMQAEFGSPSAAAELAARSRANTLSAVHLDRVAELALSRLERGRPTPPGWRELYADLLSGQLSPEQQRRLILATISMRAEFRPRVRRGDPIPCRVSFAAVGDDTLLASIGARAIGEETVSVRVDDAGYSRPGTGGSVYLSPGDRFGSGSFTQLIRPDPPLNAGTHTVGVAYRVWIDGNSTIIEQTRTIEVVPAGEPLIEFVRDAAIGRELLAAIELTHPKVAPSRSFPGDGRMGVWLQARALPIPLACDVFFRAGEVETSVGTLVMRPAGSDTQSAPVSLHPLPPDFPPDDLVSVDVVLRPSEAVALTRDLSERIWGEAIVFENVPIRRIEAAQLGVFSARDESASAPTRFEAP